MTIYVATSDKPLISYDGSAKPKNDIFNILLHKDKKWGIKPLPTSMYWESNKEGEIESAIRSQTKNIKHGDIVILQYPTYVNNQYDLKLTKALHMRGSKVISIIHDIDILRGLSDSFDIETLNSFDVIIINSHEFVERLIPEGLTTKYVVKEFWDYLHPTYTFKDKPFDPTLLYAGNLSAEKSPFLSDMPEGVNLRLWGANYDHREFSKGVKYEGISAPDDLLYKLNAGIGLIYDGLEEGNKYNEYLKYNTSAKSGLYASAGIPWLVLEDSHLGSIVKRYGIGATYKEFTTIELLKGINYIRDNFTSIRTNLHEVGTKTLNGDFLLEAVDSAMKIV